MPSEYTGDGSGITAGQDTVILCPIDSDAPNANSVNVPFQALANIIDFLMSNSGLTGVANNFGPLQTFSNGIHCGGSPITGVVMAGSPASTDAVNKGHLDSIHRAATIHFSAAGPVVDRGPATAAWLGASPVYVVRLTFSTPFSTTPVIATTLQISAVTSQFVVEVHAVSASYVDLAIRNNSGDRQRLDQDGLVFDGLHVIAMAP